MNFPPTPDVFSRKLVELIVKGLGCNGSLLQEDSGKDLGSWVQMIFIELTRQLFKWFS